VDGEDDGFWAGGVSTSDRFVFRHGGDAAPGLSIVGPGSV
jgi:hypothetical protein